MRRDEFKGMGPCNDLLRRRITICKALQCDRVYSAVYHKRKGLIKLYLAHGFKEIPALSDEYRHFEKKLMEIKRWSVNYVCLKKNTMVF